MEWIIENVQATIHFLLNLLNPNELEVMLSNWGWLAYPILFGIIFAETGILAGFFFPGDSLLFIAGFVASRGVLDIFWLNALLMSAAIIGDAVGYWLGRKAGPRIFTKQDSLLFRRSHLERTRQFYEKHGGKTIIIARFVPIVRTFAPFVAGVGQMSYRRFLSYNVFGGIGWVLSMTVSGYVLGNIPIVKRNFEKAVLVIIFLSILPVIWHALAERRSSRASNNIS